MSFFNNFHKCSQTVRTLLDSSRETGSCGNSPMRIWRRKSVSLAHSPNMSIQRSGLLAVLTRRHAPVHQTLKTCCLALDSSLIGSQNNIRFKDGHQKIERCRRWKWRSRGRHVETKYFDNIVLAIRNHETLLRIFIFTHF